jgi:hypothetical protein
MPSGRSTNACPRWSDDPRDRPSLALGQALQARHQAVPVEARLSERPGARGQLRPEALEQPVAPRRAPRETDGHPPSAPEHIRRQSLVPTTLACTHGSAWTGDGGVDPGAGGSAGGGGVLGRLVAISSRLHQRHGPRYPGVRWGACRRLGTTRHERQPTSGARRAVNQRRPRRPWQTVPPCDTLVSSCRVRGR